MKLRTGLLLGVAFTAGVALLQYSPLGAAAPFAAGSGSDTSTRLVGAGPVKFERIGTRSGK